MNITIIGAGNVGSTLGTRWAKAGHKIVFGVRQINDAKIAKVLAAAGSNAHAVLVGDSIKDAEVVVFATPWDATQNAVQTAGDLAGKVVIDATNPISLGMEGLKRGLVIGHTTSGAEQVAAWATGAKVVKAFNTTGANNIANPKYGSQGATMFICGDDAAAKATVKKLSDELGFATADAGPLAAARQLEPLAMLWINQAFMQGWGTEFALTVAKR